jgi:hypothetical protein
MQPWTDVVLPALVGAAAGAHAATWGMYKDAPHEGFTWPRYLRSVLVGAAAAPFVRLVLGIPLAGAAGIVLLFGGTYAVERLAHEVYKAFVRQEDQAKYAIPMALAVDGRVVRHQALRFVLGFAYVAAIAGLFAAIHGFERFIAPTRPGLLPIVLVGWAGGWISALGGAWKDAPIEGFALGKFFRIPVLALAYSVLLAGLTSDYLQITAAAAGFTIATAETCKTLFFPSTPRGKFAGRPVLFPEQLLRRHHFVPLYVGIWLGVLVVGALAFSGPREGIW